MAKKRILVTGGLGFIGHNVVQRLQSQEHQVLITDICATYGTIAKDDLDKVVSARQHKIHDSVRIYHVDVADRVGMDNLLRSHRPDIIVHLASFPRQKVVDADPMMSSRTMSEGLLNLLELSSRYRVHKFVYISSSMVYGDFKDHTRENAICEPKGQYGIMKLAGEWLVRDYTRRGLIDHVIIRPSAVYGELDLGDRLVPKFLLAAQQDSVLEVNGVSDTLDFTHVSDAADGIAAAVLLPVATNKTYNISRGRSRSLLEAAELAVNIVGRGRVHIKDRDGNVSSRGALDVDAARRDLGYDPKIDIEEGFRRCHEWFDHSFYRP